MRRVTSAIVVALLSGLPAVGVACVALCAPAPHEAHGVSSEAAQDDAVSHHGHGVAAEPTAAPGETALAGLGLVHNASDCVCCDSGSVRAVVQGLTARASATLPDWHDAGPVPILNPLSSPLLWTSSGDLPGPPPGVPVPAVLSPVLRI